jgi:riboflavin synthase
MFAGIVEAVGKIVALTPPRASGPSGADAARIEIDMPGLLDGLETGASIAVNGACLTLAGVHGSVAAFDVVPETLRGTNLQFLSAGDSVNLERSLRVGDRLDGHFVQGHIDGLGVVERVERGGGEYKLWIKTDAALAPYLVAKGSVAVDGTSLTLVDVSGPRFSVALVPTTLQRTLLGRRRSGERVNLETDLIARLVVQRLYDSGLIPPASDGINMQNLRDAGFVS